MNEYPKQLEFNFNDIDYISPEELRRRLKEAFEDLPGRLQTLENAKYLDEKALKEVYGKVA